MSIYRYNNSLLLKISFSGKNFAVLLSINFVLFRGKKVIPLLSHSFFSHNVQVTPPPTVPPSTTVPPSYCDCVNGGVCTEKVDTASGRSFYECVCPSGYEGFNCETSYCDCVNGGVCTEKVDAASGWSFYECVCPAGYTGFNCENIAG